MLSNPQVVMIANANLRPIADEIVRLSYAVNGYLAMLQAQGISAILAAGTQTDLIADGAPQDGRPPLTVAQMAAFNAEVQAVATAIGTTQVVQQALAIQINGIPR